MMSLTHPLFRMYRPMNWRLAVAALTLSLAGVAHAVDPRVESVLSPAWVERAGGRLPLSPGLELRAGDRVVTGAGARALLRMPEGSSVKLGENASMHIEQLAASGRGRGTFMQAALGIASGAFRFTTTSVERLRGRRDVAIRFPTVTAGIRGTDVWGRSDSDREIVCLIDGEVTVLRGADAPLALNTPLSFYVAPTNAPALPVAPVDPAQLAIWATETEIAPGAGAMVLHGRWRVVAATVAQPEEALAVYDALRAAGFAPDILPTTNPEQRQYSVRISRLATQADAQQIAARLANLPGVTPRVTR